MDLVSKLKVKRIEDKNFYFSKNFVFDNFYYEEGILVFKIIIYLEENTFKMNNVQKVIFRHLEENCKVLVTVNTFIVLAVRFED